MYVVCMIRIYFDLHWFNIWPEYCAFCGGAMHPYKADQRQPEPGFIFIVTSPPRQSAAFVCLCVYTYNLHLHTLLHSFPLHWSKIDNNHHFTGWQGTKNVYQSSDYRKMDLCNFLISNTIVFYNTYYFVLDQMNCWSHCVFFRYLKIANLWLN